MEAKVEQWIRDAAIEISQTKVQMPESIAKIIAAHAPQPSPDICEKCGQEVVDGHWSLVCHKPTCIAALQDVAPTPEEIGAEWTPNESVKLATPGDHPFSSEFGDDVARRKFGEVMGEHEPMGVLGDAEIWLLSWHTLLDLVTTQRKEDPKEA